MSDTTKDKILDTAEKLFVDNGFSATSLRAIIKEAGVNTAAIHYHFGSKEGLIGAVFSRRSEQMNAERLELLAEVEREPGDRPLPLEPVLHAFLSPVIRRHVGGTRRTRGIPQLMAHALTEPDPYLKKVIHDTFNKVFVQFEKAIARALPGLNREEIVWRIHMMVGTMVFTVILPRLHQKKKMKFQWSDDPDVVTDRLVRFVAAGMRESMPEAAGKEKM
jgi:AcrR family transcriptional regulator